MKRLVILGCGGYGKTISDIAKSDNMYDDIIFLDDNGAQNSAAGKCADFEKFIDENTQFYPAFGDNKLRMNWIEKLEKAGADLALIIHSKAYVSFNTKIEKGCAVLPLSVVNNNCEIKKGCIVNFGAVIDHDCVVHQGVHLCMNCTVKAGNIIPPLMKIEAGKVVENNTLKHC